MQDVYGLIDKLQETHALSKEEWVQVLENRNAKKPGRFGKRFMARMSISAGSLKFPAIAKTIAITAASGGKTGMRSAIG